ncbi:MAG TPA: hypothetical protein VF491_17440 [Vicinamibacterales bacterium]
MIFKQRTAKGITEQQLPTTFQKPVSVWCPFQPSTFRARIRLDDAAGTLIDASDVRAAQTEDGRWLYIVLFVLPLTEQGHASTLQVEYSKDGRAFSFSPRLTLTADSANVDLPALAPSSLPALVRNGQFYYLPDGTPFTVIEASQFRAFERFLNGEDLTPVFSQLQAEGFNTIRVWLLNTSVGHVLPWEHADFYRRIPAFLAFAAGFGLYVEFTVFTQTQTLIPTLAGQQAHYDQTVQAVGATFSFIEGVNEGDAHDNAYDRRLRLWKPAGATFDLCGGSWGADSWGPVDGNNQPTATVYDSVRYHSNDTSEWQRKQAHGSFEMAGHYGVPGIGNENTRPDRDGNLNHHRDAAAGAALLCAGSCFHSEAGKQAAVMGDVDLACARAFVAGARSVDLSQRVAPYVHRTDLEGPTVIRAYQRGSAVVTIGA